MCGHVWTAVNDVRVCRRCGLTVCAMNGAVVFDRRLADSRGASGRRFIRAGDRVITVDAAISSSSGRLTGRTAR